MESMRHRMKRLEGEAKNIDRNSFKIIIDQNKRRSVFTSSNQRKLLTFSATEFKAQNDLLPARKVHQTYKRLITIMRMYHADTETDVIRDTLMRATPCLCVQNHNYARLM